MSPLFSTANPLPWARASLRAVLVLLLLLGPRSALAQSTASAPPAEDAVLSLSPKAWADAAASNQVRIIQADHTIPVRYRERKIDARGDTTREVIESQQGAVARLIERNGGPITAEENAAERDRLNGVLSSPDAFTRHHRRDAAGRGYAVDLVRQLPPSMTWSYAPGQPQLPGVSRPQVVLDFMPDPRYKPPSLITEALTGIAGRVWIDTGSRCVLRIEGRILHPVDFGWGGLLARVGQGGTVALEQRPLGEQRWVYSHLSEHLTVREVLVHNVAENAQIEASDVQLLSAPVSYQQAIHDLLAMPVTTR